jgi:hypothetical protein
MGGNSKIFISYSHADDESRKYVEEHLSVLSKQGRLAFWSDRKLELSDDWSKIITKRVK